MNFRRIIVVDLASLGVGESGDANRYHSVGADTLGHLVEQYGDQMHLPTLTSLGLGNIRWDHQLSAIPEVDHPLGFAGKLHPAVKANYSTSTLREMFDFNEPLRTVSVFNTLARQGHQVAIISRYASYLSNQDVTHQTLTSFDDEAFDAAFLQLLKVKTGLIYVQEPQLQLSALAQDAHQYVLTLNALDERIKTLMQRLGTSDLLMITSSYAQDLSFDQRMTREYLPILLYSKRFNEGRSLGIRRTAGDVALTIAHNFAIDNDKANFKASLLNQLSSSLNS